MYPLAFYPERTPNLWQKNFRRVRHSAKAGSPFLREKGCSGGIFFAARVVIT